MNRWWGSSKDSDRQASERSARAAKRTISKLPLILSSDSDEYEDCDTSGLELGLNIDGEPGSLDSSVVEPPVDPPAAIMPDAVPFDMEDKANDDDAWKRFHLVKNNKNRLFS